MSVHVEHHTLPGCPVSPCRWCGLPFERRAEPCSHGQHFFMLHPDGGPCVAVGGEPAPPSDLTKG